MIARRTDCESRKFGDRCEIYLLPGLEFRRNIRAKNRVEADQFVEMFLPDGGCGFDPELIFDCIICKGCDQW